MESKMNAIRSSMLAATVAAAVFSAVGVPAQEASPPTVIANGLEGPRGLRFGPDGDLYIAEAGLGGTKSTEGICAQVKAPSPYKGGLTARISKISRNGKLTTVASGFPSAVNAGGIFGVADVAFLNGTLYALIAGGGCSHGNPYHPSGIAEVDPSTGKWTLIADIGAWLKTHPSAYPGTDDFEPDGALYSLIAHRDRLYAVEANHGQVISVTPDGTIKQVIDISASEGHIVPTSIAEKSGDFYVGSLNLFPIDPQWARILTISRDGHSPTENPAPGFEQDYHRHHIVDSKAGFTTVVAVAFGPEDGLLYVLELSDASGYPNPGDGKVVRVLHNGQIEEVITGLDVPTGLTFGPDGKLYISNFGAAPGAAGQILRFDITPGF
jgi:glucose/arabinose dehydrogenase